MEGIHLFLLKQSLRVLHFRIKCTISEFVLQQIQRKHGSSGGKIVIQLNDFMGQRVQFISVDRQLQIDFHAFVFERFDCFSHEIPTAVCNPFRYLFFHGMKQLPERRNFFHPYRGRQVSDQHAYGVFCFRCEAVVKNPVDHHVFFPRKAG